MPQRANRLPSYSNTSTNRALKTNRLHSKFSGFSSIRECYFFTIPPCAFFCQGGFQGIYRISVAPLFVLIAIGGHIYTSRRRKIPPGRIRAEGTRRVNSLSPVASVLKHALSSLGGTEGKPSVLMTVQREKVEVPMALPPESSPVSAGAADKGGSCVGLVVGYQLSRKVLEAPALPFPADPDGEPGRGSGVSR
jgi:hypothetical protein